ncbi:MAG: hypothetical protein L6263_08420 [Desulfobacteraceae bacterium]|nr:hypothetical protein [Desulfobacteraceae bacterium]
MSIIIMLLLRPKRMVSNRKMLCVAYRQDYREVSKKTQGFGLWDNVEWIATAYRL